MVEKFPFQKLWFKWKMWKFLKSLIVFGYLVKVAGILNYKFYYYINGT